MALKIWLFLSAFKASRALFNSTIKICKLTGYGCWANKVKYRLLYNYRFCKWTGFAIILSLLIFVAYPVKALFVDGELISLLPMEILFVDQSTLTGFITANVIMSVLGVFGAFATAYAILSVVATILNYSLFVDILEEDIKSLDGMWNGTSDTSVSHRHLFIRNICRKQQDMDAYDELLKFKI